MLGKSLTVRGYLLFEITGDPQRLEQAKKFIVDGLSAGHLKPVIAKTFPLEQIVEAHRYLESNEQIGKIVVTNDAVRIEFFSFRNKRTIAIEEA